MTATISLQRGEEIPFTVTVTQSGSAVNLTGATIQAVARYGAYPAGSETDDSGAFLVKSVGSGITLSDPTNGEFTVLFLHEDTNSLEFVEGETAVEFLLGIEVKLLGDAHARPLLNGTLEVTVDVVRGI